MSDILTERSNGILRVEFNRPEKKNAMTGGMYTRLAGIFNEAGNDDEARVVLWHSAGDAFCAGNDMGDFLKNPAGGEDSPQTQLMDAFVRFEKPIVVAVQGAATECERHGYRGDPDACNRASEEGWGNWFSGPTPPPGATQGISTTDRPSSGFSGRKPDFR